VPFGRVPFYYRKLRSTPGVEQITDEDIEAEIEAYLLGVSA
jgi:hypothetical protein